MAPWGPVWRPALSIHRILYIDVVSPHILTLASTLREADLLLCLILPVLMGHRPARGSYQTE
ncbi:hypothetical protein J6590_023982 [Homalodisca vitripennis]|nr:hypothetical protein J6590_023982 [Homalodisca vitripennis]